MKNVMVLIGKHDASAEPQEIWISDDKEKLAEKGHKFFTGAYGFRLVNGKPFDDGNDDGKTGGFDCFDNVKLYKGKVIEFMHAGGDGPVLELWEGTTIP